MILRRVATLKFIFILGSFVGLITLYYLHGKQVMRALIDKVERVGKRHYLPYSYAYYKNRRSKSGDKKTIHFVLSWIALMLIILGLLAIFGLFD